MVPPGEPHREEAEKSHTRPSPATGSAHLHLTESQRRIIASSLQVVEERVVASRRLLARQDVPRALVIYRDQYDDAQAERLIAALDAFQRIMNEIADRAGVLPARESIRRRLSANMSSAWEIIEDLRSNRLKGYGAVHPQLPGELDPLVDEASRLIREFLDVLRAGHERPATPRQGGA